MEARAESTVCSAKDCSAPADATCDRCGRPCCPAHVRQLVIQRRDAPTERSTRLDMLAHLPTRAETYALCAACWTKPVPCKPPQPAS